MWLIIKSLAVDSSAFSLRNSLCTQYGRDRSWRGFLETYHLLMLKFVIYWYFCFLFMICLSIHHFYDLYMWDYTSQDELFILVLYWRRSETYHLYCSLFWDISSLLWTLLMICLLSLPTCGKSRLFIKWLRLIIKSNKIALQYAHKIGILVSSTSNLFLICAP